MSIKDLYDINWEEVTVDDLVKAHELKNMCFEFDNGKLARVFIDAEELE